MRDHGTFRLTNDINGILVIFRKFMLDSAVQRILGFTEMR